MWEETFTLTIELANGNTVQYSVCEFNTGEACGVLSLWRVKAKPQFPGDIEAFRFFAPGSWVTCYRD